MTRFLLIIFLSMSTLAVAQHVVPTPDHIVIVVLENHSYSQIIGSTDAPNINALAKSSKAALFTQSYGVQHPSQPNYICLFSGCNQGVGDDNTPKKYPFTTANLARQLIDAGKTYISYAEDLPREGFAGESSGDYVRRHNPGVYWLGNGLNQLPPYVIQPLTAFPDDYNLLPTVSFVIPNNINNMHDGAIKKSDQWVFTQLSGYIQWAKTHNSLFILTFDEDDDSQDNHIVTILVGEMIRQGSYSQKINHYNILRTIEEMYALPYACNAATAQPLSECWETLNDSQKVSEDNLVQVFSNPSRLYITVLLPAKNLHHDLKIILSDIHGVKIKEASLQSSLNNIPVNELHSGVYIYELISDQKRLKSGKVIIY